MWEALSRGLVFTTTREVGIALQWGTQAANKATLQTQGVLLTDTSQGSHRGASAQGCARAKGKPRHGACPEMVSTQEEPVSKECSPQLTEVGSLTKAWQRVGPTLHPPGTGWDPMQSPPAPRFH